VGTGRAQKELLFRKTNKKVIGLRKNHQAGKVEEENFDLLVINLCSN